MRSDADEVYAKICRAFGDLPVPRRQELIGHLHRRDPAGEEQIRQRLAGRTWQSLDREFLELWWAAFCYLSPEAYRYYLPALLVTALDPAADGSSLRHSVLFSLRPSFWSLYYEGEDRQLLQRQALFTAPQYEAVTEFLGLVLSEDRWGLGHLAAQALRWSWNRPGTAAYPLVQAYYRRLHHSTVPEAGDPVVAALCAEIRSAFAATPYPGDDRLCGSEQGDEPAEDALELRGLEWHAVHPDLLARCDSALSFLSAAGFRYFLPAFLIADLLGYESNADPVFDLTHGLTEPQLDRFGGVSEADLESFLGKELMAAIRRYEAMGPNIEWRVYAEQRFAGFTRAERLAIIHYLEHRAPCELDGPGIRQALESYWRPSLDAV